MKHRNWAIPVLLALLLTIGCEKDSGSGNYTFPLSIGNSWIMIRTVDYFDTDAMAMATKVDTLYMEADSVVVSPGNVETIRVKGYYSGNTKTDYFYAYLRKEPDGLKEYGYISVPDYIPIKNSSLPSINPFGAYKVHSDNDQINWYEEPLLILPSEIEAGYEWLSPQSQYLLEMQYSILPDTTLTLPYGTVKCHKKKQVFLDESINLEVFYYYGRQGIAKHWYSTLSGYSDPQGNPLGIHPYTTSIELVSFHKE